MPRAVFGVEIEFDDAECGTHELQVNISSTKGEVIGFSAPIEVKPLPNYSFGVSCKTFLWETFP
jgi:hypothetical protein